MRLTPLLGFLVFPRLTPLAATAAMGISVDDGDTFRVDDGGRKLTIRVACIERPRGESCALDDLQCQQLVDKQSNDCYQQ